MKGVSRIIMAIRTMSFVVFVWGLSAAVLSAATLDEAIEVCGRKKGNAKTCCSMLLDETDEVQQCIVASNPQRKEPSAPPQLAKPSPSPPTVNREQPARSTDQRKPENPSSTGRAAKSGDFRIGSTLVPFDRSKMQPEQWQPWRLELTGYKLKPYGLAIADGKKFENKLLEIAAVIKEAPVLNPTMGCSPRLAPFLQDVFDGSSPRAKKEPLHGYMLLGCFVLDEVTRKKNGVMVKERVIGETRQANVSVNNPDYLIPGSNVGWDDVGTNGLNPFDRIFEQPGLVGEHAGFPVYDSIDRRNNNRNGIGFFFVSRKGDKPYLPVGREHFLKVLIDNHTKKNDGNKKQLESYKRQLAALQPHEREEQACHVSGKSYDWLYAVVPMGTPECTPIAKLNPVLIDPKLPRTTPQLVVVREFMDIERNSYPNKRIDIRTTVDALIQIDWNKIYNLLDKP